jgi:hypothetical protein
MWCSSKVNITHIPRHVEGMNKLQADLFINPVFLSTSCQHHLEMLSLSPEAYPQHTGYRPILLRSVLKHVVLDVS